MRELCVVLVLSTIQLPIAAMSQDQVQMDTSQVDQHAGIVRQRILLDKTVGRHRRGPTVRRGATGRQAAACASKGRFRVQYGAGNLKVQRLYSLCRRVGL